MTPVASVVACRICDGPVHTGRPGVWGTARIGFRHSICHRRNAPPDSLPGVFDPWQPHYIHQYNCGHQLYAPRRVAPETCPTCQRTHVGVSATGEWDDRTATRHVT
jgi:hypothetical protein